MLKCKVFSATKAKDRDELGDYVSKFLAGSPGFKPPELVDRTCMQSSDNEFHCVTIIIWYE